MFSSEANCIQFLHDMKILRTNHQCSNCLSSMTLQECPLPCNKVQRRMLLEVQVWKDCRSKSRKHPRAEPCDVRRVHQNYSALWLPYECLTSAIDKLVYDLLTLLLLGSLFIVISPVGSSTLPLTVYIWPVLSLNTFRGYIISLAHKHMVCWKTVLRIFYYLLRTK